MEVLETLKHSFFESTINNRIPEKINNKTDRLFAFEQETDVKNILLEQWNERFALPEKQSILLDVFYSPITKEVKFTFVCFGIKKEEKIAYFDIEKSMLELTVGFVESENGRLDIRFLYLLKNKENTIRQHMSHNVVSFFAKKEV